jgi:hypothetical protein
VAAPPAAAVAVISAKNYSPHVVADQDAEIGLYVCDGSDKYPLDLQDGDKIIVEFSPAENGRYIDTYKASKGEYKVVYRPLRSGSLVIHIAIQPSNRANPQVPKGIATSVTVDPSPAEKLYVQDPLIGFEVGDPSTRGLKVLKVRPGTSAARAGIIRNDSVFEIDGREIRNESDLKAFLEQKTAGDDVKVCILRASAGKEAEKAPSPPSVKQGAAGTSTFERHVLDLTIGARDMTGDDVLAMKQAAGITGTFDRRAFEETHPWCKRLHHSPIPARKERSDEVNIYGRQSEPLKATSRPPLPAAKKSLARSPSPRR